MADDIDSLSVWHMDLIVKRPKTVDNTTDRDFYVLLHILYV
jgi:hypothetical protein